MSPGSGSIHLTWSLDGQQREAEFEGSRVVVGRLPACDVVLKSDSVSRQHAEFRREGNEWSVWDLRSKNGVYVNEARVQKGQVLKSGDGVRLGTVEFRCTIAGKQMPSTPGSVLIDDTDFSGNMTGSIQMDAFQTMLEQSLTARKTGTVQGATPHAAAESTHDSQFHAGAWIVSLFHDAAQTLLSGTNLDKTLEKVLDLTFRHLPVERGFVCLLDEASGDMLPKVRRSCVEGEECEYRVSQTIVKATIDEKSAVLFQDTGMDSRFQEAHSIVVGNIHSAMCAPLYTDGKVGGFIYIDTQNEAKPFQQDHLQILSTLAILSAVAVEQTKLREDFEREQKIRARLSRYSSPNVVEELLNEPAQGDQDEDGMLAKDADVSVLFADLSGFTPLSEYMSPGEVTRLLNSLFERLTEAVFEFNGTLDKFIGDEIMAFFGAPLAQADHAALAARCGLRMQEKMKAFNETRRGAKPLEISIGINSGPVVVGDIGSQERRDYTVIGGVVNLAKRIESYCAAAGQVVVGPSTYADISDEFDCEPLEPQALKGLQEPIETFLVRGTK